MKLGSPQGSTAPTPPLQYITLLHPSSVNHPPLSAPVRHPSSLNWHPSSLYHPPPSSLYHQTLSSLYHQPPSSLYHPLPSTHNCPPLSAPVRHPSSHNPPPPSTHNHPSLSAPVKHPSHHIQKYHLFHKVRPVIIFTVPL